MLQAIPHEVVTLYSDTRETLTFSVPDLLFIEADDNYCTVHWRTPAGIRNKLLRLNLKRIETQIAKPFIVRCHRSYLVNSHAISNILGNTNGFKLKISNSDFIIPVSRQNGKQIISRINEIRNAAQLQQLSSGSE
jgi:DNA-binding LytR/AlgR family response regulator